MRSFLNGEEGESAIGVEYMVVTMHVDIRIHWCVSWSVAKSRMLTAMITWALLQ